MLLENIRGHMPEWIEASSILIGCAVILITASVNLHNEVKAMHKDVEQIKAVIEDVPLLIHKVEQIKIGLAELDKIVHKNELDDAAAHQHIEDCCNGT